MPLISGSCNSTSIILLTQSCATLQTNHCLFHSEVNKASGGALALINTSSPSSTLWVRCDPSTNMVPNCEFQRRCNWSPCLNIPLLRHCTSSLLGAFSIMCSRIRYCKSVDETFIGIPPAAAIAALNDTNNRIFRSNETQYERMSFNQRTMKVNPNFLRGTSCRGNPHARGPNI